MRHFYLGFQSVEKQVVCEAAALSSQRPGDSPALPLCLISPDRHRQSRGWVWVPFFFLTTQKPSWKLKNGLLLVYRPVSGDGWHQRYR